MTFKRINNYAWDELLKIGYTIFLILLFVKSDYAQLVVDDGWKLAKDKKGIIIYTRPVNDSKLNEFKLFTSFNTKVEKLVRVLLDVENYDKWGEHVKYCAVLEKESDNAYYIYSEAKLPWPFVNRDIINLVSVNYSVKRDTAMLIIEGYPDYTPEKEGIIRIPVSKGWWHIYQVDEENVRIEYSYKVDPGGSIPAWLLNMFIVDGPYKTMINMKEYLETIP